MAPTQRDVRDSACSAGEFVKPKLTRDSERVSVRSEVEGFRQSLDRDILRVGAHSPADDVAKSEVTLKLGVCATLSSTTKKKICQFLEQH